MKEETGAMNDASLALGIMTLDKEHLHIAFLTYNPYATISRARLETSRAYYSLEHE